MAKRPKPKVHGRDHEHGGPDPHRIHYEDVGDSGGGTEGVGWFTAENSGTQTAAGSSTKNLNFTDPGGFYTNDPASFDLASDHVRILQPGFYALTAMLFTNVSLDSGSGWLVEILDVRGLDASSVTEYGMTPATPRTAVITKEEYDLGGGMTSLVFDNFYNLRDDYTNGGPRPVDWPLVMTMRMSWTVSDDHPVQWTLVGTRYA